MKIFIPIKKESERVPNKNFRDFGGVPLYMHTLNKFKDYEVFVNTDCAFLKVPDNVTFIERKEELCGHDVSVNLLIKDFLLDYVEDEDEIIFQTHVTSPFLSTKTIDYLTKFYKKNSRYINIDSYFSVNDLTQRMWGMNKTNCLLPLNHDPRKLLPTQKLDTVYLENSAFYMFTKKSFLKRDNRIGLNASIYSVKFPEYLDIDTEDDFKLCLAMQKGMLNE